MADMTLLEEKQVIGDDKLKPFAERIGSKCLVTDFAILLGCDVSDVEYLSNTFAFTTDRTAPWALKDNTFQFGKQIKADGSSDRLFINSRKFGVRPCVSYSSIKALSSEVFNDGVIHTVHYGFYPQTIVNDSSKLAKLEKAYSKVMFGRNNAYTVDSTLVTSFFQGFNPRSFCELEHPFGSGNRYIRFIGDDNCNGKKLSNGVIVEKGSPYWIKVEPIVWYVDDKADIAFTKKIILSGLQIENATNYDGKFDKTHMKDFLNNYFAREIIGKQLIKGVSDVREVVDENIEETPIDEEKNSVTRKVNPYDFEFEQISEEDIIRGAIESNVAVFLHGKSSDGKSARVKQIDPDCVIVYLRNATPDSLNGKSVYNESKGEMIDVPPSWYKKIKEKCEAEPDKLHIVFFDELTNAMPSIQGMAFNIILDKEVNGVWKLPSNCRIVAAGNDMDDSISANAMAEPLFNRFAHVYIETTIEKWLKWAAKKENNIHPAIFAYISYKASVNNEVLRTRYDGKKPNADPRKWEMASKMLYATGKPNMLKGLIGEGLTKSLCEFCSKQVITLDRVVKGEYADQLIKLMRDSEKFATALNLSRCDEKDLKVVRDFVSKLGVKPLSVFDILWSKGDDKRIEKIAKIRLETSVRRD